LSDENHGEGQADNQRFDLSHVILASRFQLRFRRVAVSKSRPRLS
jgi:hypothetical protein